MDKKQVITVSILGALIVALVCFVVIYSGNTERLTKNQVLRIGDTIYEVSDVEKYLRIASSESGDSGDINATFSEVEKGNFYELVYLPRKAYASVADEKKILFPEEELNKAKEDFAKKSSEFAQHGITEKDYIKYREDQYKEENLNNNFTTYFQLPDEDYKEMISGYSGDELKTYTFRLMKFSYEEPVSGESGDIPESGDIAADEHEHSEDEVEEKEDRSKATMLLKAQTALEAVKSGDDFETVAKEYADMDYTINENGFKTINGEVLTQVVPIIQNQMSFSTGALLVPSEVFEKMKTCEIGGYTEIIDAQDASGYYFVKVENVEDGFVGEADKEFRELLFSSIGQDQKVYWDNMVYNELDIEINQSALVRYLYK